MPVRKWGTEQLVNGVTAGNQQDPTIATLAGGGYVIAWEDYSTNANGLIRIQRYDTAGRAVGTVITVDDASGFRNPSLTALADGGFMLGTDNRYSDTDFDPHVFIYNSNGGLVTNNRLATAVDVADQIAVARNGTGAIAVWHDADANNGDIIARLVGANGAAIGPEFTVSLSSGQSDLVPDVIQLGGGTLGDLVFAWNDGYSIRVARASHDDGEVFDIVVASDSPEPISYSPPHIAALENGGFVVVYAAQQTAADFDSSIRAVVFGWNGTKIGSSFQVSSTTSGYQMLPDVVATADGGFVAVWVSELDTINNFVIRGQAFGPLGNRIGNEFVVSTGTVPASWMDPPSVSAAALADGRIVVTWEGKYVEGGDTSGSSIRSQIIDPRGGVVNGSAAAETLYGHELVNDEITALAGADKLFGLGGSDALYGGDGTDTLDGGVGADLMYGGAAGDLYVLDNTGDLVDESGGGGSDTVQASAFSINLADTARFVGAVENAWLVGAQAFQLTGNALANVLTGNAAANLIDGRAGADTMRGGAGNDLYIVDSASDVVDETSNGGAGTDTVRSSATFTLGAGVENLELVGAAAISGTGNAAVNSLDASQNSAANTLRALGGSDRYIIGVGDTVDESVAGSDGIDLVQSSSVSINFGDTVHFRGALENIWLEGTAALSATGNALVNVLYGSTNAAANVLRGLGGGDVYVVGSGDIVDESVAGSGGVDTVQSQTISVNLADAARYKGSVENVMLVGPSALAATGNSLANTIAGNSGANTLAGGAGIDTLTGGAGGDFFVFNAPLNAANRDVITDFSNAAGNNDSIRLDNAVMTALGAPGALKANFFFAGAAAHDADDHIIYDKTSGALSYDSNGITAGGVTQLATLTTKPVLTAADFAVI
jgi:Ca2+-binding RTX toxin-like protein